MKIESGEDLKNIGEGSQTIRGMKENPEICEERKSDQRGVSPERQDHENAPKNIEQKYQMLDQTKEMEMSR
jgi:hypothetical protein